MGEQLVIQIEKNEQPIANAYYHWSACTTPAIELTKKILKTDYETNSNILFKETKTQEEKDLIWAVNLLRSTGAEILEEDLKELKLEHPFIFGNFLPAKNRNDGLIAVFPSSIEDNMSWALGTVTIDIVTKEIKFDVLNYETDIDSLIEEELIDDVETLHEIDPSPDYLNFDNFEEFSEEIDRLLQYENGFFKDQYDVIYSIKGY